MNVSKQTISPPSLRMKILMAGAFVVSFGIAVTDGTLVFMIAWVVFAIANCVFLVPFAIWGYTIQDDQIEVSFPFWPRYNRQFKRADVELAEEIRNPIRLFSFSDCLRLRFKQGKEIVVVLMGTTQPQHLLKHLIENPNKT